MKRFWDKVKKTDGCWNWIAGTRGNGYGTFKFNGKAVDSHRFVWLITFGEIPKGMFICHHCDNRKCVRPDHLFLGTAMDNIVDAVRKGIINNYLLTKFKIGHKPYKTKLTKKQVIEIREKYKMGSSCKLLGKIYGIHPRTILKIIKFEKWKNI